MFKIGYRAIYQKNIIEATKEAKRYGFDVLEVHLNAPNFEPEKYSTRQRREIKLFAQKNNVQMQMHASLEYSLLFTNKDLRAAAKNNLREMIIFGQEIGALTLTLHPGKVAMYHGADGKKLKDDDVYDDYYLRLFEDSIIYIISIAPEDIFICMENTDNFNNRYMQVLHKYLPSGKIFLTWDIMKNYFYDSGKLNQKQWRFFLEHKKFVKNVHVSGQLHSGLNGWENKLKKFFKVLEDDLPVIIEVLPLKEAIRAKNVIEKLF